MASSFAPLKVALVGLGDIAKKAYLPVLAADRSVTPVLITRNEVTRAELMAAWRIPFGFPTVRAALESGVELDAAFVHAATTAHVPLATELIDAGIPTLVDKPVAYSAAQTADLVLRARAASVSLAVGFNRRYAPQYAQIAAWPGLDAVVLTKNRVGLPDDARTVIFDDFVHVVDTLRFMVTPNPEHVVVSSRFSQDGSLSRVAVTLTQADRIGVGIMDRDSGQTIEILEGMAPGRSRQVDDLTNVVDRINGGAQVVAPSGWESVSARRGFVAMIADFLGSVRRGEILDAQDALDTHELCERILAEALASQPARSL